jgi:mandelate racemase
MIPSEDNEDQKMAQASAPRIQSLRVRAVRVPMQHPHQTASGTVSESPLVLTDALIDDGTVGHSVVFTYTPAALKPTADLLRNFETLVKGEPLAPAEVAVKLSTRFRLLGTQGLVGMALAAIDMALWDALARSHSTSLASGGGRETNPAYGASDTTVSTARQNPEDRAARVKAKLATRRRRRDPSSARSARGGTRSPSWSTTTSACRPPKPSSGCACSTTKG